MLQRPLTATILSTLFRNSSSNHPIARTYSSFCSALIAVTSSGYSSYRYV